MKKKLPFFLHTQTAGETSHDTLEYAGDLAADGVSVSEFPYCSGCGYENNASSRHDRPHVHFFGHGCPYGLDKEVSETPESENQHQGKHHKHDQEFPSSLQYYCTQDLIITDAVSTSDNDPASDKFADSGKYEIGDVSDIYSVECGDALCVRVYREQKFSPPQSSEPECEYTSQHGEQYEPHMAFFQTFHERAPLDISE